MSRHVSATSSDLRSPVLPANMTIVCTRSSNSPSKAENSPGERTSGSLNRFAEARTFVMGLRLHSQSEEVVGLGRPGAIRRQESATRGCSQSPASTPHFWIALPSCFRLLFSTANPEYSQLRYASQTCTGTGAAFEGGKTRISVSGTFRRAGSQNHSREARFYQYLNSRGSSVYEDPASSAGFDHVPARQFTAWR